MKFTQLLPSALVIALISGIYIYIAQYFQVSALWLPYISWSAYFIIGAKPSLLPKMTAGFAGGMFIGLFTVFAIGPAAGFVGSTLALPVVVFFMALFILLMELIKPVDLVPVYFFSYASYFAFFYGKFGGEEATPVGVLPDFFVLLMVGLGLGYLTSEIRRKIMHIQGITQI